MDTIIYLGISQSLFAAILMLTKSKSGVSDKVLIAWLFFLAIEFTTCAFDLIYFDNSLLSSVFLLINPAFFLYIKSLTNKGFRLQYIQLLHLLPYLAFEVTTYFIQEPFSPNFLNPEYPYFWFSVSFSAANIISFLVYNLYSIILVYRHRINIQNEFSTIDSYKKIAWVLFVLIYYVIYCTTALSSGILALRFDFLSELPAIFSYSMMLSLAYIFGFYGLKQAPIYSPELHSGETIKLIEEKYKSSILSEIDKENIKKIILKYFEKEKPYLNPDFSMSLLSKTINIPKHHITEVLNMDIGMNFFSFVNEYRVDAVKKMLLNDSIPYSIEAIGYECGFNSKSTFFNVFKNLTGITPLQFKNQYLKE